MNVDNIDIATKTIFSRTVNGRSSDVLYLYMNMQNETFTYVNRRLVLSALTSAHSQYFHDNFIILYTEAAIVFFGFSLSLITYIFTLKLYNFPNLNVF